MNQANTSSIDCLIHPNVTSKFRANSCSCIFYI
jgi:hypothetical protein